MCRKELFPQHSSNSSHDLIKVTAENQEEIEQILTVMLSNGFSYFNPSPECDSAFREFVCDYSFGACDEKLSPLATGDKCRDVRDRLCVREWPEFTNILGFQAKLPICEDLPEVTAQEGEGKKIQAT